MFYYTNPAGAFRRKSSGSSMPPGSPPNSGPPGSSQPFPSSQPPHPPHASHASHVPSYSAGLVESPVSGTFPFLPRSPHTPAYGESLPPVEDRGRFDSVGTGASRQPLFRDFGRSPDTMDTMDRRDRDNAGGALAAGAREGKMGGQDDGHSHTESSFVFVDEEDPRPRPPEPPTKEHTEPPHRIPPPSVHDAYVSRFLSPLDTSPDGTSRPPLVRSNSAPGVPQSAVSEGSALLPSALADEKPLLDDDECGKPIFDIFGAELSEGGKDMVRALKGHLEEVLKVQEEVGRMHLALEGLGDYAAQAEERHTSESEARQSNGDEVVAKREKGIEEIMDRLGALSDQLRTYHSIGTPKLSFPAPATHQPKHKARTMSIDPAALSSSHSPISPISHEAIHPQPPRAMGHAKQSSVHRPSPLHNSLTPESAPHRSLPRSHSNLDQVIPDALTLRSPFEQTTASSHVNVSPKDKAAARPVPRRTTTEHQDHEQGQMASRSARNTDLPPLSLRGDTGAGPSGVSGGDAEKKEVAGEQRWVEKTREELRGSSGSFTHSPVQMVDRSRPW
ncbi:hypothetical protein JCM24511_04587 [Saitozyma sp. JCM 24511]|nr:hypothetical protein JCM24511_04587 [Saitozyma sp. JCM 24511]